MLGLAALVAMQTTIDPLRLPIGRKGETRVEVGRIVDLRDGSPATADDIAAAADGKRFVFLGEQHATDPHQRLHARIIEALVRRGRRVAVGLEMITRPKQEWLDRWSFTNLPEDEFLSGVDWKGQWGYDYRFYRPVFEAARSNHLPMIALNVPREWVRAVGKGGYAALSPDQKAELPDDMSLDNANHKQIFDSMTQGHPMSPNGYAAQVLWDEGMADTAIKWLDKNGKDPKTVFVVIAGAGHVMYGQGINYRVRRRHAGDGVTVVMTDADAPVTVSNGVADFVYVSRTRGR